MDLLTRPKLTKKKFSLNVVYYPPYAGKAPLEGAQGLHGWPVASWNAQTATVPVVQHKSGIFNMKNAALWIGLPGEKPPSVSSMSASGTWAADSTKGYSSAGGALEVAKAAMGGLPSSGGIPTGSNIQLTVTQGMEPPINVTIPVLPDIAEAGVMLGTEYSKGTEVEYELTLIGENGYGFDLKYSPGPTGSRQIDVYYAKLEGASRYITMGNNVWQAADQGTFHKADAKIIGDVSKLKEMSTGASFGYLDKDEAAGLVEKLVSDPYVPLEVKAQVARNYGMLLDLRDEGESLSPSSLGVGIKEGDDPREWALEALSDEEWVASATERELAAADVLSRMPEDKEDPSAWKSFTDWLSGDGKTSAQKSGWFDSLTGLLKDWGPVGTAAFVGTTATVSGKGPIAKFVEEHPLLTAGVAAATVIAVVK